MNHKLFFVGEWQVTSANNTVRKGALIRQLEPKAMDVLVLLCQQQGEVFSAEQIIQACWKNANIGDNPIHKVITQLRKAFDDKASAPLYIETIRKRGYRIISDVSFPLDDSSQNKVVTWQGASPFPGLNAYDVDQADIYFGRNGQIIGLLERLSIQIQHGRAFCLLLGASGTGKSSLINAGVLPKLLNQNGYDGIGVQSYTILDLAEVGEDDLFIELAACLLDWEIADKAVYDGLSAESLAGLLTSDIELVLDYARQGLATVTTNHATLRFFIFIDRLEVLLTSPYFSVEQRALYLAIIETLACSDVAIVFSACRHDFYPQVVEYPSLMKNKDSGAHFDLMPPSRSELLQMIRLPAQLANLTWGLDPDSNISLDELLCDEAARHPEALPMLQYTLQELYLRRSLDNELLFSVYLQLGGIEGAIGKKTEQVFDNLPQKQQLELSFLLSQLVTVNVNDESITSKAALWSQLLNTEQKALAQTMVENRLFVSHLKHGQACFSLAHEALLRRWPRAKQWIAEHQESLSIKSQLQQQSEKWLQENKNPAYLLQKGKPLYEAKTLQANTAFVLTPQEQELIKASNRRYKNKQWIIRGIAILLCCLTVTSVLTSIKSYQTETYAQQKRMEAENLLGFMVGEFADKLRSVKRMDLLDGISNKALEYFSQQDENTRQSSFFSFTDKEQHYKARFQHAQTLGAMGEVAYSRGKNDEAKQAFSSAKVILEQLNIEQADNVELLKTLGANAFWLGQLAMDSAQFIRAKALFELYLTYSQTMLTFVPNDLDAQWELSYAYMGVGSANTKLQQHQMAKTAFENAFNIQSELIKGLPDEDISHLYVADTLEWLAESEEQLGYLQRAVKTRKKAQGVVQALLLIHKDSADLLENLAYSHFNTAVLDYYLGEYSAADQAILASIQHFELMLVQDPLNEIWQLQLLTAQAYENFIKENIHKDISTPLINIDDFKRILNRAEKFDASIVVIIKTYQLNGNWPLAQIAIDLSKPVLKKLVSQQSSNSLLLSSLSNLYLSEAKQIELYQVENNSKSIVCEQVITTLQSAISLNSSFELMLPYVQAHDCLGQLDKVEDFVTKLKDMQIYDYQF